MHDALFEQASVPVGNDDISLVAKTTIRGLFKASKASEKRKR